MVHALWGDGKPDLVFVEKGQYVGIEFEAPKGKQGDNQKDFQERLEAAGGRYILAYSVDRWGYCKPPFQKVWI